MDLEAIRYFYLRRVVGTAVSMLGVDVADRWARGMGRAVFGLGSDSRRRAEKRCAAWLGDRGYEAPRLVQSMYEHVARFWVEAVYIPRLLRESSWRSFVSVEEEAALRRLAHSRRGCVLATSYFGNVGVLAWTLGQIFRPIHVVAHWETHSTLRAWQREAYSLAQVSIVDRREAATRVPKLLEGGGAVLVIAEHERSRGAAIEADFLGATLRCHPTIARLARCFEAPVGVVTCRRREEAFRFDARLHGVVSMADGRDDEGVMREVLARMEDGVREDAAQYWWPTPVLGGCAAARGPKAAWVDASRLPSAA